jgi:thiamine-phosphate pyrophosphorylase
MSLPKLHYVSQGNTVKEHLENIQTACSSGAELVQLRLKDLSNKEVLKAAEEAREITTHFQTKLIINDYYKIAKQVKADGVHLGKNDTDPSIAKITLDDWVIIGGTANSIQDCRALIDKKVNYIGLGPHQFTNTKKNLSPVIGYNGYLTILKELNTKVPIIAIGGITLNDIPELLKTGVYGIAASGERTKDFNKINQFNKLLRSDNALNEVCNADLKI